MATLSTFSTLPFVPRTTPSISPSNSNTLSFKYPQVVNFNNFRGCKVSRLPRLSKIRASVVEEQETLIPDEQAAEASQPSVSVSVSPSDVLTMFFQAEGTMPETAISSVSQALEETEGISNLKVQVLEGIATVELTKQTTVQATGVASSLVEIIQGSGFKLQTLNLSFEDEEDIE
ncbi:hypothetical protein DCAR_0312664 [Daucus carota subsp. sativus]|uniref:Uncharacterized protein n=1 Tax=Daucus carota subsp. sativus TaxID=79200 RepID=A0A166B766_DAUCS|nr:PREDICTED: uncharacterized protein LOC108211096 [Daucus carota subsp. sativus]WOG93380.1 hypothetical protein DCAR_0312664 [Daucus carota subsp. sativus]